MSRADSRAARRVALLTFGVALAVVASTAGVGIIPGSMLAPHDGGEGDSLPDTDDYDDPLVDYDAVDYELALNSTAEDDLSYSLTVLGAVEPVDDAANGTVDCTDQLCRVEGTLEPDEVATYHVSGSIVGVQPKEGLIGHVNGTFEGDALVGTGWGALSPAEDDGRPDDAIGSEDDEETSEPVADPSEDGGDAPGENNGEDGVSEPPENGVPTENYSFEVTGMNVLGDDPDEEYVTLNNTGETMVDMSGWTLRDRLDGGRVPVNLDPFVFPEGFELGPGEEVTVWTGDGTDDAANLYWGVGVNVWNQTGDTIVLRTADGETVLEHQYGDQTPAGSYVSDITYENCSTVTIDGEGEFGVEINTAFYGPDGVTSMNYENDVSLPATIDVSDIDDAAVTDIVIEHTTVTDGTSGLAAERSNPDREACGDEIDAQYEDWQDNQSGDDNRSGDDNQSDRNGTDDEATAADISIAYEGCSTVSIDVEGDASAENWEIWELSTRFYTESGIDTMILEPDDGIPTTIDANERVEGAVTDVEIENVMLTGDGGETFVEASQPDESCGDQINQQWEEYQDESGAAEGDGESNEEEEGGESGEGTESGDSTDDETTDSGNDDGDETAGENDEGADVSGTESGSGDTTNEDGESDEDGEGDAPADDESDEDGGDDESDEDSGDDESDGGDATAETSEDDGSDDQNGDADTAERTLPTG